MERTLRSLENAGWEANEDKILSCQDPKFPGATLIIRGGLIAEFELARVGKRSGTSVILSSGSFSKVTAAAVQWS